MRDAAAWVIKLLVALGTVAVLTFATQGCASMSPQTKCILTRVSTRCIPQCAACVKQVRDECIATGQVEAACPTGPRQ